MSNGWILGILVGALLLGGLVGLLTTYRRRKAP
jgi:LPXTG-motif cell wall-anchored protein